MHMYIEFEVSTYFICIHISQKACNTGWGINANMYHTYFTYIVLPPCLLADIYLIAIVSVNPTPLRYMIYVLNCVKFCY